MKNLNPFRWVKKVQDVEKAVKEIREVVESVSDDEKAHSMEDALHEHVLRLIAKGDVVLTGADMAAAALKTKRIKFARWCG